MDTKPLWETKFETCYYSTRLLDKISILNQTTQYPVDVHLIRKAIYYTKKYHDSQIRLSGEPYYTHPIEVAFMVCDYLFETEAIITSLLHDTLEDTALTYSMIVDLFGELIAEQVEGLTRIKSSGKITSAELVKQLWVEGKYNLILIKLFDRIHNLQTIFAKSPEKQRKIIDETLKYFLALGDILEVPSLTEAIYKTCYETNKQLGLIAEPQLILDKQIKFSELLTIESS